MATHTGHRERLRARFRANQLNGFAPHEILELLLSYGIPQKDVNPLAHDLIARFGSLVHVLSAAPEELEQVPGMGPYSATLLSLIAQIAGYYQHEKYTARSTVDSIASMGEYCTSLFLNSERETLMLVGLDIHGKLIGSSQIIVGSLDELTIYTRDVVNAALNMNAYGVVITHNHPGGSLKASEADIASSLNIRYAMEAIGIDMLDHIIVGRDRYSSMASCGLLYPDIPYGSMSPLMKHYLRKLFDEEPSPDFCLGQLRRKASSPDTPSNPRKRTPSKDSTDKPAASKSTRSRSTKSKKAQEPEADSPAE